MVNPVQPPRDADPAALLRWQWGRSLDTHLKARKITRSQFRTMLLAEGLDVSVQTISNWRNGKHAPKAHHQAVIARVLMVPVQSVFPLEAAA